VAPKVSVVVPTFRSGLHLHDTVRSLDRQTLPASEFEIIFVDDGSPDDTYERLRTFARDRPNVRYTQIPHSGWPCLPRNTGIDMAGGEYVLFLDHDDQLAPRTLEAAWRLGARNCADAVNVKESRTHLAGWALPIFDRNRDNAIDRDDHNPLGPLTPHKLYRRAFLDGFGIRFPATPGRLVNEDLYFNIDVLARAEVISILSEEAGYHWVTTGVNNSNHYFTDARQQLASLENVLNYAGVQLAHRPNLLEHVVTTLINSQVLPVCGALATKAGADWEDLGPGLRQLLDRFVTERIEHRLDIKRAAILELIRAGRTALLGELAQLDSGLFGLGTATRVQWLDGHLHIEAKVVWQGDHSPAPSIQAAGDRVLLDVSTELVAALSPELVDVTDAVQRAEATFAVRSRKTAASWLVKTSTERHLTIPAVDGHTFTIDASTDLDIDGVLHGRPLDDPVWDVFLRASYLVGYQQRRLRVGPMPRAVALIDGRCAIAYRTQGGTLALDLEQVFGDAVRDGGASIDLASVERCGRDWVLRVPLLRIHVHGETIIPVNAVIEPLALAPKPSIARRLPFLASRGPRTGPPPITALAAVRAADGAAWLEIRLGSIPSGTSRILVDSSHCTMEMGYMTAGRARVRPNLTRERPETR
jgi:glycosyltransferase involved in cell wall biosynthesis